MANFQAKSRSRRLMESTPMLFVFALILIIFTWNVASLLGKMNQVVKNREVAETRLTQLANTKARLEADIALLATDEGIEETIREKYGLGKEGERLVVVVEDKNPADQSAEQQGSFTSFFKNLFK